MRAAKRAGALALMLVALGVPRAGADETDLAALERFTWIRDLAHVLAAERPCELAFDPAAVMIFVERGVPDDAIEVVADLARNVRSAERTYDDAPEGAFAAMCFQALRVARDGGFLIEGAGE